MKMVQWIGLVLCQYLAVFAALAYPGDCFRSQVKDVISAIAHPSTAWFQKNVTRSTLPEYQHSERELFKGIELIESMKTATTCKTESTEQLLTSCSALDGTAQQETRSADELEKIKEQYAARLAVCELKEAEDPPKLPLCSLLGSRSTQFVNRKELAACLRELQNNPAFWTSYVNNLQNVGYMCQVAQAEIEKKDLVKQRRASLQTTLLVTKALSEFQKSVAIQNAELLTHAQNLRDMHRQMVQEMASAREDNAASMDQFKEEYRAHLQMMANEHMAAAKTMMTNAHGTNKEMSAYAQKVQYTLEHIWQQVAEMFAEFATQRSQDTTNVHEMALATQQALDKILNEGLGSLAQGLSGLSVELQYANTQITSLHRGHVSLADNLNHSLAQSVLISDQLKELEPLAAILSGIVKMFYFIPSLVTLFVTIVAMIYFSNFLPVPALRWAVRVIVLLATPYVTLCAYASSKPSLALRFIIRDVSDATMTLVVMVLICLALYPAARLLYCACRKEEAEFQEAALQKAKAAHALEEAEAVHALQQAKAAHALEEAEAVHALQKAKAAHALKEVKAAMALQEAEFAAQLTALRLPGLPADPSDFILTSIETSDDEDLSPGRLARRKSIVKALSSRGDDDRLWTAPPY